MVTRPMYPPIWIVVLSAAVLNFSPITVGRSKRFKTFENVCLFQRWNKEKALKYVSSSDELQRLGESLLNIGVEDLGKYIAMLKNGELDSSLLYILPFNYVIKIVDGLFDDTIFSVKDCCDGLKENVHANYCNACSDSSDNQSCTKGCSCNDCEICVFKTEDVKNKPTDNSTKQSTYERNKEESNVKKKMIFIVVFTPLSVVIIIMTVVIVWRVRKHKARGSEDDYETTGNFYDMLNPRQNNTIVDRGHNRNNLGNNCGPASDLKYYDNEHEYEVVE